MMKFLIFCPYRTCLGKFSCFLSWKENRMRRKKLQDQTKLLFKVDLVRGFYPLSIVDDVHVSFSKFVSKANFQKKVKQMCLDKCAINRSCWRSLFISLRLPCFLVQMVWSRKLIQHFIMHEWHNTSSRNIQLTSRYAIYPCASQI